MTLLTTRRLGPLLATQALGAVNDNLFKNALVVLVLFKAATASGPALVAAAGGLFILPYVVLSATAGQLADRFEKSRLILIVKAAEVALMAVGAAGFLTGSLPLLFAVLFGLGVQATFFSPLKYAILPSHLAAQELVAGNGLVEAGTFLGILAGTIAGSALAALQQGAEIVAAAGLAIAAAGVASAAMIPLAPSAAPGLKVGWNPARETALLLRSARLDPTVWRSLLALSWFWVVGATVLAELPALVHNELHAEAAVFTLMLGCFSVGVGGGSLLCSRLLRGEVTLRLVPLAGLGLSIFLWDFGRAVETDGLASVSAMVGSAAGWRVLADLLLLAACGGLYSVPLYAMLQTCAPPAALARTVAANNVVNAAGMTGAAVLTAGLALAGVAPATVLLLTALVNVFVAGWLLRLLRQEIIRALLRWYFRTVHGVDLRGWANLPGSRHATLMVLQAPAGFAEACLAAAYLPGAPLFAIDVRQARRWWARPLLPGLRTVAIDCAAPFSLRTMVHIIRPGRTLVVLPSEGVASAADLLRSSETIGAVADRSGAFVLPLQVRRAAGRFDRVSLTVLPPIALAIDPALRGRARRHAAGAALRQALPRGDVAPGARPVA